MKRQSIIALSRAGGLALSIACLVTASGAALAQISPSPPELLNTNATVDSGNDQEPDIAMDGAGNWVAVWASEEDLNGAQTD